MTGSRSLSSLAKLFLPLCLATSSWLSSAQVHLESPQNLHDHPNERENAAPNQRRSTSRFLGWKYAAIAHQDTSRWTRKHPDTMADKSSAAGARTSETQLATGSLSAPNASLTSYPYAGFAAPRKLFTGYLPTAVVQGDFNGDGKQDVAISNGGDNTIYVYLGNGDGTLGVPEVLYTTGQSPVWLAAASLRKNGPVDLIAVDGDSNGVEVFFGNGNGSFQPGAKVASLPQSPTFVVAADFNKDGFVDLAVGLTIDPLSTEPQFEVLLGNGAGAFSTHLLPPPVENPGDSPIPTGWLAAGDLNKDGYPDVVATVAFGGATSYLNQGGAAFVSKSGFGPEDGAVTVELADTDGDGCLDAIETGSLGFLTIAKGNCDGTFAQTSPTAELGDVDAAVAVTDVSGDGKLDVIASAAFYDAEKTIAAGSFGGYLVSVLNGDGTGHLMPAAIYRVGPDAFDFTVVDLSGSGHPDVIAISQTEDTASILVNDGKGGFGSPSGETVGYSTGVSNAPNSQVAPQTTDVNGDGKLDVVLIEYGEHSTDPSVVATLLNDGSGKLLPPIRSPITVGPNIPFPQFVVAKFRSSSPADLIYLSELTPQIGSTAIVAFMPGNGDGSFGAPVTLATPHNPLKVVSGDFNGDGKMDFALFGYSSGNLTGTELDVFLGNGDGTFRELPSQQFPLLTQDPPQQLIAGDVNHDGKLDLLIANNANSGFVSSGDDLDLALGNGDGTFQAPTTLMPHFGPVAVADLNGDGYLDLVQVRDPDENLTGDAILYAGIVAITPAVTVYLGGPGGTFTKQPTYIMPGFGDFFGEASYAPALVGDFNGDGKLDIASPYLTADVASDRGGFKLQILQGNGDGTFTPNGIPYQLPLFDVPVVGGDYRGVGVTDLLDLVGTTASVNTLSAVRGPALAITTVSSPLTGTQGGGKVTLALPAPSGETVQLTSSDPAVVISPASLTFSSGQTQQSFSFTLGSGFNATHLLAITATLNGESVVAYFAKANPNLHPGVTAWIGGGLQLQQIKSTSTYSGGTAFLILTMQSVAGYSGILGNFSCSGLPAGAQCTFAQPNVTLFPGGYGQVGFEITTDATTPTGTFNLTIGGSNAEISVPTPLTFDVGGLTISANPAIVQANGINPPALKVTADYTNGFDQAASLSCTGLPTGASCSDGGQLSAEAPSFTITLSAASSVAAQDYPFQIVATAGNLKAQTNATLRVSTFTASLQTTSVTVASGHSTVVNVQLTSVNHFNNSNITVSCQTTANVTCSTTNSFATLTDGGTATVAPSVSVGAIQAKAVAPNRKGVPWEVVLAGALAVFLRTRRKGLESLLGVFTFLMLLTVLTSCGGGGGATSGTGGGNGGGGGSQSISVGVIGQATTATGTLQVSAGTLTITATQ
jgi:hypothetical protein